MRLRPEHITKELFLKLYVQEGLSVLAISKQVGKSTAQVSRYLKIFEIPTRAFSTKGLKTRQGVVLSRETKDAIRLKALGRRISLEVRKKMGSKGSKNPGWIDGRTPVNKLIRHSIEYKEWRKSVFERDEYTCKECGKRGGELHAHHEKPFAYFPELRFEVKNGKTMCVPCHRETDSYGSKLVVN